MHDAARQGVRRRPRRDLRCRPITVAEPPPEIAALPPAERPDRLFAIVFGPLRAEPMLHDLMPIVENWQPHLLVCEQGELAGPLAAAHHGVPNVTVRPADPIATDGSAEPLVYVTLGTVFNDDLELFRVAVEAASALGIRVVVTLGPGNDPAVLGPQPSHVTVEQFIPQSELLPACAAVVSHAGSGTFLAALAAGVPQVLLPQAADQFLNAQAGEQGGVAIAVPRAEVPVERVREALERVIDDGTFRAAAEGVRTEISAMPTADAVVEELERRYGP